jgi:hypothetical protein
MHRLPPLPDVVPQLLGNDPQLLVLVDDPFGLGLVEPPASTRLRISSALGAVPDPSARVLLVVQDAADRRGRPSLGGADAAGTFSLLNVLTIWVSDKPSAYDVKMRRITAASLGSISIL